MKAPEPQKEHKWLQRIVGDWTCEGEASMGPGQPPMTWKATESVRALGEVWVVGEARSRMPEGDEHTNLMSLGFDTDKKRFVGTFISSMMTGLWVYNGSLDAGGSKLTLDTEGPHMADPSKTAPYKDIVEMKSDDERTLTSLMQVDDGSWVTFMTATYRRVK
jgi:Protein of unknown function (DUF1579)